MLEAGKLSVILFPSIHRQRKSISSYSSSARLVDHRLLLVAILAILAVEVGRHPMRFSHFVLHVQGID